MDFKSASLSSNSGVLIRKMNIASNGILRDRNLASPCLLPLYRRSQTRQNPTLEYVRAFSSVMDLHFEPAMQNVTFKKHLKQKLKRKVYCDGFLSLCTSTSKVMPYDGSEQLSECRILKNDEVICSEFWLSFWCEVHYDPLYKIQDAPITEKETLDILEEAGRSRCWDLQEMGTKFIPSLYLTYIDSAFQIAQLALQCLQMTPNEWPSRTIVVAELESVEAAGANRIPWDA